MDVTDPELAADPVRFLGRHRSEDWAWRSDRGVEVLRYDQIWQTLTHRQLRKDAAEIVAGAGLSGTQFGDAWIVSMLNLTGPEHSRLRGSLAGYFTPGKVEAWRPIVRDLCARLIGDPSPGSVVDLIDPLCRTLPGLVFCRMIGAPEEDAAVLCRASDSVAKVFQEDPRHRDEILTAASELHAYVLRQLDLRRADPGDDLLSSMIAFTEGGKLNDDELISMAMLVLEASTETSTAQIALTISNLLADPEQWALVVDDPSLAKAASIESIRLTPTTGVISRVAVDDVVVDDVVIPAGTSVICAITAGQHDESIFVDPDRFDMTRVQLRALIFGGGPHYCVGAALAQIEIEETVRYLAEVHPEIALAGRPTLTRNDRAVSVRSLPVSFS
ncbi:cytochrome P450 [soil metagenome]